VSNFEQPVATKERMFVSIRLGSAAPPSPDTHAAWSKPRNPKRVRVNLGFNLSQEPVMAQENEHIQTLVAELEHRREFEKALAEVVNRALAGEERFFVLHSQGGSLR
jgi:uncharacterized protein YifE (UPF0438 family)